MKATEDRYQGWTNYETWCLNLWLMNEELSYRYWTAAAAEIRTEATERPDEILREKTASFRLADRLKNEIESEMPELAGPWGDMLQAATGRINWDEIAKSLLE